MRQEPIQGVLFDLLMAVMDSPAVWAAAAGDAKGGLAWRDAVTRRMAESSVYAPFEELVEVAARERALPAGATSVLFARWPEMSPRPDALALARLSLPYAFVTNCSRALADLAAARSGLRPSFVLSAEEAGWYKPDARIYQAAWRKLGSPPDRTLFVAGAAYDAEGAANAGLRVAYVARRSDQRRPRGPMPVVKSLEAAIAGIVTEPQAFRYGTK
jgi:2-haloalkanoic acid dehalogenase type II